MCASISIIVCAFSTGCVVPALWGKLLNPIFDYFELTNKKCFSSYTDAIISGTWQWHRGVEFHKYTNNIQLSNGCNIKQK